MDHTNTHAPSQTPAQPDYPTIVGPRTYRSKLQRPCDICRARKVLCNIPDATQPCLSCQKTGRQCTFKDSPKKKLKSHNNCDDATSPGELPMADATAMTQAFPETSVPRENDESERIPDFVDPQTGQLNEIFMENTWPGEDSPTWGLSFDHVGQWSDNADQDLNFLYDERDREDVLPAIDSAASREDDSHPHPLRSIDERPNCSAHFMGYSNESDPFSLNHFPYNRYNELDFFQVTYRKMPDLKLSPSGSANDKSAIHFTYSQSGTASVARGVVNRCMSGKDDRKHLESLVDVSTGIALVNLYLQYVFESLPIVSRSQISRDQEAFVKEASTGLLAGMYTLALPFVQWDETLCLSRAYSKPGVDQLWEVAFTCLQKELHFPRLSTVQTSILLLNFPPFDPVSVETAFVWSSAASMLAIAQSLGLCIEPSGWDIPKWEIRLRRRLWWAVLVEYSWRSITHGRASTINDDDWNVLSLTSADFETDLSDAHGQGIEDRSTTLSQTPGYFIHLCSLTQIANKIFREFFSLRAITQPHILEVLIEQAKALRQELLEWHSNLPAPLREINNDDGSDPDDSIKSHGSLLVSYYTAHILVLRALLRPLIDKDTIVDPLQPNPSSMLQSCREFMQTMIKFVRELDCRHQSAFWPAYTRHCLAYPGLFCYMLCLQRQEPHQVSADRALLDTWRKALRARTQNWPFMRFAIVKVDALYWKKLC